MQLKEQLDRQRVKYIVSSYQLAAEDTEQFDRYLDDLLEEYPTSLIELALVENLIDNWLKMPMPRGCVFLEQTHQRLRKWENCIVTSTVSPSQFQQVTGLDPRPIFGFPGDPSLQRVFVR
jgi:hypothetical protein